MYQAEQRTVTIPVIENHDLYPEYRAHGWSVADHAEPGRAGLMMDGCVDALAMPAELGERVQRILSIHMLAGPVLSYPADGRWVFLTEPGRRNALPDDVATENVAAARPGTCLRIPAGRRGSGEVRWVSCPERGRQAPPRQAVICAARRALSEVVQQQSA